MKERFSVLAARLQAQRPYWSWSQVCAELGRRSALARKTKTVPVKPRLPYADADLFGIRLD